MTKDERSTYWQSLIDKHAESGSTAAEFCREHQINAYRFYHWRRRFRNEQSTETNPRGFVELVPYEKQSSAGVRIHLSNELSIEVERGFDALTLRSVIQAVRDGEREPCLR
jgi:transposase-like protein